MNTHELAKKLLEQDPAEIRLFYGFEEGAADKPEEERRFATCPFNIYYGEDGENGKMAVIMPVAPEAAGETKPGVTRKDVETLFTEFELQRARAIKEKHDKDESGDKPSLADTLQDAMFPVKKMKQIDEATGQENNSRYWAYALEAYLGGAMQ